MAEQPTLKLHYWKPRKEQPHQAGYPSVLGTSTYTHIGGCGAFQVLAGSQFFHFVFYCVAQAHHKGRYVISWCGGGAWHASHCTQLTASSPVPKRRPSTDNCSTPLLTPATHTQNEILANTSLSHHFLWPLGYPNSPWAGRSHNPSALWCNLLLSHQPHASPPHLLGDQATVTD